ncbi:MAG TPA: hypothetical protein VFB60_14945 [Ktedonobacteraceae bacterium]|nr:hypothetical protein [Ktedonobacteraceae bacterium]
MRHTQRERICVALTLLLGPETDQDLRVRATRRLARQGLSILPQVLTTLSSYPAITTPTWPAWPPQYKYCSHLLLYFCRKGHLRPDELLQHPSLRQPPGPVLWISVIEAAELLSHDDYEALFRQGLTTSWTTVRYAAAMALATRASRAALQTESIAMLHAHQHEDEAFPVRLAASYALLNSGEDAGLQMLLRLTDPLIPAEIRKAAAFVVATALPVDLTTSQHVYLGSHFLALLHDADPELTHYAAQALGKIALPALLPPLSAMLNEAQPHSSIAALLALEELAHHTALRHQILQQALPARILPLLKADIRELRRQASYTLAACGGEYVMAVFGSIMLNEEHPGYIEVIEGLRLLHGVLRSPIRIIVIRWLLLALSRGRDEVRVKALDSLGHLLWQARKRGVQQAWYDIGRDIILDGSVIQLLHDESVWVRQCALELLAMLGSLAANLTAVQAQLPQLLANDSDSGVRACVACVCGQIGARWAIPGLILALLDPDEYVALTALHTLEQIATFEDAIVVYVLTELAYDTRDSDYDAPPLAREARALLRKWQKSATRETTRKLHSSL